MNFDQRIAIIKVWMKQEISPRFTLPKGADPYLVIEDIIETVNSNIAGHLNEHDFKEALTAVRKRVVQRARGRTLPPVYDFLQAAADAGRGRGRGPAASAAQGTSLERELRLVAQAIMEGRPIAETWLRHERRKQLIERTEVTEEDLVKYGPPGFQQIDLP